MATSRMRRTTTPPASARRLRTSRRSASRYRLLVVAAAGAGTRGTSRLVPDAGVESAIEEVYHEVHDGEEGAVREHHRHDHRVIAPGHGLHEEAAHAGHA